MRIAANTYLTISGIKFTIKNKNNRWHISYTYKSRRINKSSKMKATKENLGVLKKIVLPQIAQELNQLSDVTTEKVPVDNSLEDFAETHFALHSKHVRIHVYKKDYRNYIKHILPYFEGKSLKSILPMELELWQNRLLEKYKPLTVQRYRSIFYTLFTRAFQNNLVTKNPFDSITAPKMRNNQIHLEKSDVMNPFTQLEINTLVEADDDTYMINFILLMANSGIRPGELIALTWKDINFVEKTININKTIISGSIGLPKTQSSIRVIDMISGAYIALKNQYRLTGNVEYVFLNSKNKIFFNHDIININFKKRLRIHNIPVRPLYQLRHSFASRMIKNGIDITWVSKTLGHKDSAITLKVYTKFIQEDNETRLKNITKINQKLEQLAQVGNMETSLEIATISTNIDKKEIK